MTSWSRRQALKGIAIATLAAPALANTQAAALSADNPGPLTLWYRQPAKVWTEALAIGNGRLGAMVFGGVDKERLQLNEDTLWSGGPYDPANPDALAALPEVRALIAQGKYAEAEAMVNARMMGKPVRQMSYQTLGDLGLEFPGLGEAVDYRRDLDLDRAVATTRFRVGDTIHTREVFASPVDQVLVVRLSAEGAGRVDVDVKLSTPQKAEVKTDAGDLLAMRGRNGEQHGVQGALRFTCLVRALPVGGTVEAAGNHLKVRGAESVVLLLAAATSFRRYDDVSGDPDAIAAGQVLAATGKPFARLLDAHLVSHRALFRRVAVDLGTTAAASLPTDERVRDSEALNDPALAALYHQFGRYLLICSSRPGTQPANLQGIWNDSLKPSWGSKYTININTEMNYWPAEPTALPELAEPLVSLIRDIAETGARTARTMYGARGWMAHHNTDLWRATAPIDGAKYGMWPVGGAWLCLHLWDHYDYGRDRDFLASVYPLMKGAAEFFLDTLVEAPKSGFLMTSPSLSPENRHPHGSSLVAGPAMDQQILRDLFDNCVKAAEILGLDPEFRAQAAKTRARLAPDKTGRVGQLQEWVEDWDMQVPEIHHRHVSHLYAVYPSGQIDVFDTPELAVAARKSLEIRGDEATGWGIGWRLNLWARLGDAERAHLVLRMLLRPKRTYPNLFDSHPPFQIDGNFGGTSGITEMVLRSRKNEIHLLPALPGAWPKGSVTGLRARGAVRVDLSWSGGKLDQAVLEARVPGQHRLRLGKQVIEIDLEARKPVRVTRNGGKLSVGPLS
ncbi:glycosyl hydrolase family 95 catalytic domain-containing protein [Niveispirillum sp. KHB5.9]|uniref:glycoside hydrolase family 95 protein n=1 Tax=Niveispirillum sp. KHB5.9 TaxID=3400269 RepID=UPI003A8AA441